MAFPVESGVESKIKVRKCIVCYVEMLAIPGLMLLRKQMAR